ncbi:MAG: tetratricopeptide repeat protein [Candidatus Aphodosoma sp.]
MAEIPITDISAADDTTKVFYNLLFGKAYLLRDNIKAEHYLGEAITLYEQLKFKYPSYIDMLIFRAYASDALGKREEAARWYRKALIKGMVVEHNGDLDNCCYLNLGNIYNENGDCALAKEYYNKIQWLDSLQKVEIHADYYAKAADRYLQYGKSKNWIRAKAINDSLTNYCLTKYGEKDNYYLSCLQNEGTIQYSLGDYDMAIKPYIETLRIGKKYGLCNYYEGYAYCRLIELYCNQDRIEEAISLFPEAVDYIKKLPNKSISEVEPCLFIGMACVRNGDYDIGIMALEKFLSLMPEYMAWGTPYAINKLSWAYLNVGKNQEVIDLLEPILARGYELPDNFQALRPYLHKTLGCSFYVLQQKDKAIINLKEAIKLSNGELSNDSLIQEIFEEYGIQ